MSKLLFSISVLSGLVSFSAYNLGFALEKKAIQRLPEKVKNKTSSFLKAILTNPLWLFGLFLTIISVGFYFVALMWAPLSAIAPLSGFGLIIVVIFAHLDLKESLRKIEIFSFVLIIIGSCTSSYLTSKAIISYSWNQWTDLAHSTGGIVFLCLSACLGISFLFFKFSKFNMITTYMIAFFSGTLAGIQAIVIKGTTVGISNKAFNSNLLVFLSYIFTILMAALFSSGALQFAFKKGNVSIIMAIYNGIMTLFPILFGGIILIEWENLLIISKIFLGIAVIMTLIGVIILSIKHSQNSQDNNL
ncbi:MAG: hypothetical protein KAS63_11035 [Candidatus Heimdallarchaeota archaeon]|nr:hypothetical protein [Candidatus Heimdallarchaeota archaeon]MCK4955891.1 hypothetical protein [Candidatus Heimdallarchaeota archaeon]